MDSARPGCFREPGIGAIAPPRQKQLLQSLCDAVRIAMRLQCLRQRLLDRVRPTVRLELLQSRRRAGRLLQSRQQLLQ
jgi:hypothetical protein